MQRSPARLLASVAVLAALSAGGCSTTTGTSSPDTTGSIATDNAPRSQVQWRQEMDSWGERYRANPSDPDAAVRYAQALRAVGQRAQAAAVLEQAALHNQDNRVVLGAYGRALADTRRISPIGASCRCRARCLTRWAVMSMRSGTMPVRCV
jgi:Flp pilus assembly protein TadD